MKTTQFSSDDFFNQDIVQDSCTKNHKPYEINNYAENLEQKSKLITEYKSLPSDERKKYKDLRAFFVASGFQEIDSMKKNYQCFSEEINARIEEATNPQLTQIQSLSATSDVFELLHSFENIEKLKSLYKYQKKTCNSSGINNEVAEQLKYCFLQGRELFTSGKNGATSVKPLLFFYSLTAYAFGLIVLNNPIRFSLDSLNGHHGLDYSHDEFGIKLGGNTPYGTFTDLFQSIPVCTIMDKNSQVYKQNIFSSIETFFETDTKIKLGSLFSYIPELSSSIQSSTGGNTFCKQMTIKPTTVGRELGYEIIIGDGKEQLSTQRFDAMFNATSTQLNGNLKYLITDKTFQTLKISIFQDIYGKTFLIDDKIGYVLPEILIHFMILFAFSNIQRYDPPLWGEILSNKINSNVSYLIYKYFSVFENKLPYLILRLIGDNYPMLI